MKKLNKEQMKKIDRKRKKIEEKIEAVFEEFQVIGEVAIIFHHEDSKGKCFLSAHGSTYLFSKWFPYKELYKQKKKDIDFQDVRSALQISSLLLKVQESKIEKNKELIQQQKEYLDKFDNF